MKCWVCSRQARGYGHTDNRHVVGNPRRYPIDWVFCSQRCQDIFHTMYGNWQRVLQGRNDIGEVPMVDPTETEMACMKKCLKAFGEAAEDIGFDLPLAQYSAEQALQVIDAIVSCYVEAMALHHASSKYPPVRGLPETPDPLQHPFSDMESDLPWEEPKGGRP